MGTTVRNSAGVSVASRLQPYGADDPASETVRARESLEAGWQIARALLARPAVAHWQACTT